RRSEVRRGHGVADGLLLEDPFVIQGEALPAILHREREPGVAGPVEPLLEVLELGEAFESRVVMPVLNLGVSPRHVLGQPGPRPEPVLPEFGALDPLFGQTLVLLPSSSFRRTESTGWLGGVSSLLPTAQQWTESFAVAAWLPGPGSPLPLQTRQ